FRLLLFCHRGCNVEDIMAAVGLDMRHLFPSDYAVFKARKKDKKKRPPTSAAPCRNGSDVAAVSDAHVENLTKHAKACFRSAFKASHLQSLAQELRLPAQTLADFGVGWEWHVGRGLWVFNERDGKGRIVGLLYRDSRDGRKWCHTGSRRGII